MGGLCFCLNQASPLCALVLAANLYQSQNRDEAGVGSLIATGFLLFPIPSKLLW